MSNIHIIKENEHPEEFSKPNIPEEWKLTDEEIANYLDEERGAPCMDFQDGFFTGANYARQAQLLKAIPKIREDERKKIFENTERKIWYRGLAEVGLGKRKRIVPCIQITEEDWQALKRGEL